MAVIGPRGHWTVAGAAFLPSLLTTELALHHLLWQGIATIAFVALGALATVLGQIALAITALVAVARLPRSQREEPAVHRRQQPEALCERHSGLSEEVASLEQSSQRLREIDTALGKASEAYLRCAQIGRAHV